jgi:hypothetical protein
VDFLKKSPQKTDGLFKKIDFLEKSPQKTDGLKRVCK